MSARRVLATTVPLAAALVLAGCVTSGTVTGKSHDPAYDSCVGTPVVCSPPDECWHLGLRNDQGDRMVREGDVCVPRQEWERTGVGEFYDGPTVIR